MARPIKHNADYFPHDADMRNDPRIKALRRKFGIEGYGVYSMLLEFLADSDYFEFKNDSLSLELVAGDFDIETDKLVTILQYCFQLDLFQLDAKTNIISCKSLDKRLEPLLSKRKRDRSRVFDSDNTQSKVKESKVKESKEEYINNWLDWGKMIVEGNDQFWDDMRGRKVSQNEMDEFISIATRNGWDMESQQSFRVSLKGFKSNNPQVKKNVNPGKT